MPASRCRNWSRQVLVEMRVQRIRNVPGRVRARAPLRLRELKAAIENGPARIGQACGQLRWLDQRRVHGSLLSIQSLDISDVVLSVVMAIDIYWASGSPYAWRVLLALEYKHLRYTGHLLQFSKQEHKSPQMLALNPRGRVPVLKDGDYVCFESLAVLYYLDLKYPEPPIFGRTPEEAGTIMRVICEYQAYIEPHVSTIVNAVFSKGDLRTEAVTDAMHHAASEARTIE